MPTENRSSNTEMISVPSGMRSVLSMILNALDRDAADGKTVRGEMAQDLRSVMAQLAPQPHPEPIAWMVGTAFWWTKEEAERDAAETGLSIVGLGPMGEAAEVERLREALKFYADRDHFAEDIGSDWDTVSGEPANVLWHDCEAWFVEDGSIARAALGATPDSLQLT
ncbi:hypothetical protein ACIPZ5_01685 [Pseudomonas sp. NPDC089428]|uniref:hypothetical protein n=1 Tax=Pseudomonas sp. NPDC089428 TaxID=3364467 RepID=UPI00382E039A